MQVGEKTGEALERAFAAARLDTLTTEEVLAALHEDGIDSYESLVDELMRSVRRAGTPPQALGIDVLARESSPALTERTVQRVPQVPLTVDGIGIEPHEISRFDGRVLHFVAGGNGSLAAFTDGRLVSLWLQIAVLGSITRRARRSRASEPALSLYDVEPADLGAQAGGSTRPSTDPPNSAGGHQPPGSGGGEYPPGGTGTGSDVGSSAPWTSNFVLYQNAGWSGLQLGVLNGQGYSDLTEVGNGWFGDWNDQASSISSSDLIGVCGEHINFDGSRLIVLQHTTNLGNLNTIGWNDRISSVYAG